MQMNLYLIKKINSSYPNFVYSRLYLVFKQHYKLVRQSNMYPTSRSLIYAME